VRVGYLIIEKATNFPARYWMPDGDGYACSLVAAGVFSLAEAVKWTATDGVWFVEDPLGRLVPDGTEPEPPPDVWDADEVIDNLVSERTKPEICATVEARHGAPWWHVQTKGSKDWCTGWAAAAWAHGLFDGLRVMHDGFEIAAYGPSPRATMRSRNGGGWQW
jgi:hypothetical protein